MGRQINKIRQACEKQIKLQRHKSDEIISDLQKSNRMLKAKNRNLAKNVLEWLFNASGGCCGVEIDASCLDGYKEIEGKLRKIIEGEN